MNTLPAQIGPYRPTALLGQGDLAVVYRAEDTLYERNVALKVLLPHLATDRRLARLFVNSGREAMRLRHPNIVAVHDAGQADDAFYIAMDLVDGESLATRLQPGEPLSPIEAQSVVAQLASALDYAHRQGVLHHNLKPSNVWLTHNGRVQLSDFDGSGAATQVGTPHHPLVHRLKSPAYLAPEQARGDEEVGTAADIYGLAALGFAVWTGRPPFVKTNPLHLLHSVAEETALRADKVNPAVPAHIADALALGLDKDAAARPERGAELVNWMEIGPTQPTRRARRVEQPPVDYEPARVIPAAGSPEPWAVVTPRSVPPASRKRVEALPIEETPGTVHSETVRGQTVRGESVRDEEERALVAPFVERMARSMRRAEPMAMPALAVLVVGGLAALLILMAAMRSAGGLMAGIGSGDGKGELRLADSAALIPTVTPTPSQRTAANSTAANGAEANGAAPANQTEGAGSGDGNNDSNDNGEGGEGSDGGDDLVNVRMAVVVTLPPTPKPTATNTPEPPTATPTALPSDTPSPTPSVTPTDTPSPTPTDTPTPTLTPTPTATNTPTPSPTPTITPAPTAAGLTGKLAYTLWNPHTDRPDIYVWDMAARINASPIPNMRQPDFSPHGGLAANAEGGGMDNLVQMGAYGENPWIISAHPEDSHPHWSADGKKLVFASAHMGDRQYRIYLQDDLSRRDDRPPMMYLAWELFGRYPIFLNDGRIAYNGCNYWDNGSICGIYVVDTQGGMPSQATNWPRDVPTDNLGARVLMMSDRNGNWDIYSMNPDGSDLIQLTDMPGVDGLATASPDGANIAFLTDRDGVWSIYVMRPDGSDLRKVFDLPGGFGQGQYDWFEERLSWGR